MHLVGLVVAVVLPLACAGAALTWVAGRRSPNKRRWDRAAIVTSFVVCLCLLFTDAIPLPHGFRLLVLAVSPAAVATGIALLIWRRRTPTTPAEGDAH